MHLYSFSEGYKCICLHKARITWWMKWFGWWAMKQFCVPMWRQPVWISERTFPVILIVSFPNSWLYRNYFCIRHSWTVWKSRTPRFPPTWRHVWMNWSCVPVRKRSWKNIIIRRWRRFVRWCSNLLKNNTQYKEYGRTWLRISRWHQPRCGVILKICRKIVCRGFPIRWKCRL